MHRLDRPRQFLGIAVAAVAGYVDAVGFLSANSYFVSFMSGNTTRMATEFVRMPTEAAIAALLIAGFVAGVTLGSIAGHASRRWRKPVVLALVAVLLSIGAGFGLMGQIAGMLAALVLAMGAINNTLQAGEAPVALTYMTGALVRIGQCLAVVLRGEKTDGLGVWIALWLSLAGGALFGAVALLHVGPISLLLPIVVTAGLAIVAVRLVRS